VFGDESACDEKGATAETPKRRGSRMLNVHWTPLDLSHDKLSSTVWGSHHSTQVTLGLRERARN
jgi:hypothetical protein